MSLKENKHDDEYYFNILNNIKRHIPEFETVFERDEQYLVVFEFGKFLLENISNNELYSKAAEFINEALEIGNTNTEDMIVMQIFQQFYDLNEKKINFLRSKLSDKARSVYDLYYKKYHSR